MMGNVVIPGKVGSGAGVAQAQAQAQAKLPTWVDTIRSAPKAVEDGFFRCLVYGSAGSGKTTFAGSFPSPLFLDFDRGLITLRKDPPLSIPFRTPRNRAEVTNAYTTVLDILSNAANKTGPFAEGERLGHIETIVLDSYTSMARVFLYETMFASGGDPTQKKAEWDHYGVLAARLVSITERLKEVPMNVVACAGDMLEKEEATGTWAGKAAIVGGFRDEVEYFYDEVYYFSKRAGSDDKGQTVITYEANTVKFRYFNAKTRLSLPSKIENITHEKVKAYL